MTRLQNVRRRFRTSWLYLMHEIDSLDRRMKQAIRNCMERNKDNDLGKYLRENYKEE